MSIDAKSTQERTRKRSTVGVDVSLLASELESARMDGNYPLTLTELAVRCSSDAKSVLAAAKKKGSPVCIVADSEDSPCTLAEDAPQLAAAETTMRFLARRVENKRRSADNPMQSTLPNFITDAKIHIAIKAIVKNTLTRLCEEKSLPESLQPFIAIPQIAVPLPERMSKALQIARAEGEFPLTVAELARRCSQDAKKVLGEVKKTGSPFAIVVDSTDSPCAFAEEIALLVESDVTIRFLSLSVESKRATSRKPIQSNLAGFVKDAGFHKSVKAEFETTLKRWFDADSLPLLLRTLIGVRLSVEAIASRLLAVVGSQKKASVDSYPVPMARLTELACLGAVAAAELKKAYSRPEFKEQIVTYTARPDDSAVVVRLGLVKDITFVATEQLCQVIECAVATARIPAGKAKAVKPTTIFSAAELASSFVKDTNHRPEFESALLEIDDNHLSKQSVGRLMIKGEPRYFRMCDVEPASTSGANLTARTMESGERFPDNISTSAPTNAMNHKPTSFSADFSAAFDRLFELGGRLKSVKISGLRSLLKNYSREEFDSGLNRLRKQQEFTLEPNEGQRVALTTDDQDAVIIEAGQQFYFCRRK